MNNINLAEALEKIASLEKQIEEHKINDIKKNTRLENILKVSDKQQMSMLHLKEKYKEAKITADRASKAKTIFLSNMSHEIRTPMNSIMGFSELLDRQLEDEKLKVFCRNIKSSGATLLQLINDILNIAKIESGKMELVNINVSLLHTTTKIRSMFQSQADSKGVKLIIEISEDMPVNIFIDQLRLDEILINLISNAIKFTQDGFVRLKIEQIAHGRDSDNINLSIKVEDTGIGILPQDQEIIFDAFEQAVNQDENRYGGTGLGLSITKKIVTLMGGTIKIDSKKGKGTSLTIVLEDIEVAQHDNKEQKVFGTKEINQDNKKSRFIDVDFYKDDLEDFLNELNTKINNIHNKAIRSNNFNKIKLFCSELKKSSAKYNIVPLIKYSDELLKKIDISDVDSIVQLLNEYNQLVEKLENIVYTYKKK